MIKSAYEKSGNIFLYLIKYSIGIEINYFFEFIKLIFG